MENEYSKKTKFFAIHVSNSSDKDKEIKLFSEFSLQDKDLKYSCNGEEDMYYKILKEIEKNPLLIHMIRVCASEHNGLYNKNLLSVSKLTFEKSIVVESTMLLPLSHITTTQFQSGISDIKCAFKLDYSTEISYKIKPNSSVSFCIFSVPYDKEEHNKLLDKVNHKLKGHPIWITNNSYDSKLFKLHTDVKDYDNENIDDKDLEIYCWGNKASVKELTGILFSGNDVSSFFPTRMFCENENQFNNYIQYDYGSGENVDLSPKSFIDIRQFIGHIADVPDKILDNTRIINQYYNKQKLHPSYLKMVIQPKTTVCLWLETFK